MDKSDKRTAWRSERHTAHWEQSHRLNQQRIDYRTGILASPSEVDAAEWNALLAAQPQATPFLRHEFLSALNAPQWAVPDTGWAPQFVTLTDARTVKLAAAAPVYLKG